ncbi:MAG: hypothetical protein Fur0025_22820 [Oscillatoriaceae cyanobacterium]
MPKVSVCIPTYNRVQLLQLAIASVQSQIYQDWELIICDDGSTDGTAAMMAQMTDRRIHYIRHPQNIGKSNNMRSGFAAATGEYFIKFDDDDRLTPDFLAHTCAILDNDPTIDFVGTDHWVIDIHNVRDEQQTQENSRRWGRSELPPGIVDNLLEVVFGQQSFQIGATLFRRQTLQELDYMRPNLQNCEDNDLFVRLALAGKKGYYLPERLMEYRFHAQQQGIDRAIPYLQDKIRYLASYQFDNRELEAMRQIRLAGTQEALGLRLIEKGETMEGRRLLQEAAGVLGSSRKSQVGLMLSYLPLSWRQGLWRWFRQVRPKDDA